MAVEGIATAHYRRQALLGRRAAEASAQLWAQVDGGAITASWAELTPHALTILGSAQSVAAASSAAYVGDVADAYGLAGAPAGQVRSGAFAGVASDGRPLGTLLQWPPIAALRTITAGGTPTDALLVGRLSLDMIVRTQIADAGRVAGGVAITARRQMTGYVRMTVGKSCSRCIILAGKRFRWNAGFARHPRCDCRHIPIAEDVAGDVRTDPRALFRSMSREEQDRVFTRAGAQAVRDGADMNQVVNSRRGMQTAGESRTRVNAQGQTVNERHRTRVGTTTTESTGRSGVARRGRLMPEAIYEQAGDDRDRALALLGRHGYLI